MLPTRTSNKISNITSTVLVATPIISTVLLLLLLTVIVSNNQEASAQQVRQQSKLQQPSSLADTITIQNTSMSIPAPNAPVNNQSVPHQIVVALPIRAD